jgi:hypothetical protein
MTFAAFGTDSSRPTEGAPLSMVVRIVSLRIDPFAQASYRVGPPYFSLGLSRWSRLPTEDSFDTLAEGATCAVLPGGSTCPDPKPPARIPS